MDLRKIVEEIELRKREHLALVTPPRTTHMTPQPTGLAASLLQVARERMERESPGSSASVTLIEPDVAHPKASAPTAKAVDEHAPHPPHKRAAGRTKDDFLARYLDMSAEFETRFKVKGWTDLVRKKCSAQLRK